MHHYSHCKYIGNFVTISRISTPKPRSKCSLPVPPARLPAYLAVLPVTLLHPHTQFMADLNMVKQSTLLYATDAQKNILRSNPVRSYQKIILFCSAVDCIRRIQGRMVTILVVTIVQPTNVRDATRENVKGRCINCSSTQEAVVRNDLWRQTHLYPKAPVRPAVPFPSSVAAASELPAEYHDYLRAHRRSMTAGELTQHTLRRFGVASADTPRRIETAHPPSVRMMVAGVTSGANCTPCARTRTMPWTR